MSDEAAANRAIPIVALDFGSADEALAMARRVGDQCRFFKVGSELFTTSGPAIVRRLQAELGADVFLDLKFNDIPNTVAGAVRSAAALGVRLLTVHASGGRIMLEAAQAAWRGASERGWEGGVLAVTVLTSFDAAGLAAAWGRGDVDVEREVMRLAGDAAAAGLHGIVCSGGEVAAVRRVHGDGLALLVPGIRLRGGDLHDQQRVMSPSGAQAAGARYLVIGRAVTGADDPAAAMAEVVTELSGMRRSD
ncbi:MAG: pyrF [Gemmatimonadetes bacterium]|jgi:orotidine-5'-phosphate decarboxylase|nr:pyrF [Gemmatimonadota bacterium]